MNSIQILHLFVATTVVLAAPRKQFGPEVGDEFMHGVLMHGDQDPGDSHKGEDIFRRLEEQDRQGEVKPEDVGPKEAMEFLHGVMMHGDDEQGVAHMHQDRQKVGPEKVEEIGPIEGMEFLHGVAMHGDAKPGRKHDHDHEKMAKDDKKKTEGKMGPKDIMEDMHGVLMHGDTTAGESHEHEDEQVKEERDRQLRGKPAQVGQGLEALMHGGDDDHVHDKERSPLGAKSSKPKGVPSISDPHEALHGDMDAQIQLGEAPASDEDEYQRWKDGEEKSENTGLLGFTFPFITDSLINEVDLMKRRWMAKFWGEEDDSVAFDEDDQSQVKLGSADVMDAVNIVGSTDSARATDIQNNDKAKQSTNIQRPAGAKKPADNRKTTSGKRTSKSPRSKNTDSGKRSTGTPKGNSKHRMHDES